MMMQSDRILHNNQIWYWAAEKVTLYSSAGVVSHDFSDGKGVVTIESDITTVLTWLRGTAVTSVELPKSVTSIGMQAFYGCGSLVIISMPDGVTDIGSYAFANCAKLELAELPNHLQAIGSSAFQLNYRLAITALPHTVTQLGAEAFYLCYGIQYLTVDIATPPICANNTFAGTNYPIYVPASSVDAYKAADGWSAVASRIYAIEK